ncbi:MAG: hypothetical protein U0Y10_20815 [Spirosomataceae bacterium]
MIGESLLPPTGKLEKLKIYAFEKMEDIDKAFTPQYRVDTKKVEGKPCFTAMFNPTTFTTKTEIEYETDNTAGSTSSEQKFKRIKPADFSVEFVVDGTGASYDPPEGGVVAEIERFYQVTRSFIGTTHRTTYLLLLWGTNIAERCVLKSCDVTYSLFKADGTPLRAKISASFVAFLPKKLEEALKQTSSPDLTHLRDIKDSDHLALLAKDILEDPLQYLSIARVNDLDQFRKLRRGQRIFIPPVRETKP